MICISCEKTLTKGDEYIKFEDERYCSECYESYTRTYYFAGEFLGSDEDGVAEYGPWDREETE